MLDSEVLLGDAFAVSLPPPIRRMTRPVDTVDSSEHDACGGLECLKNPDLQIEMSGP